MLVGEELSVGDGAAADGDVADEPADDAGTVAAGTVTGGVLLAADAGKRAPTGSVAGLFLATAGVGVGAGVAAGDGTAWICGPSRPDGLTASLIAAPPVKPAELADPAR